MNDISVCDGINCKIKNTCLRYKEYLKYNDDISLLYLWYIEPKYNGTFCINYLKTNNMIITDDLNVIEGYVARDGSNDLWLYEKYPMRMGSYWLNDNFIMSIPNKMFPNIKWEDEPIKVELTIKAIK